MNKAVFSAPHRRRWEEQNMFKKKDINKLHTVSDLQAELKKRSPWKKLNPDIIDILARNANGDADVLRRFIYISEKERLARNYLEIVKDKEVFSTPEDHLALFAVTLQRLGSQYFSALVQQQYGTEQHQISTFVTVMSYESALLCNKFLFTTHCALAELYANQLKWHDKVEEIIAIFDQSVDELNNTNDSELCTYNQTLKKDFSDLSEKIDGFRELCGE